MEITEREPLSPLFLSAAAGGNRAGWVVEGYGCAAHSDHNKIAEAVPSIVGSFEE
jgi:hypothetical protein